MEEIFTPLTQPQPKKSKKKLYIISGLTICGLAGGVALVVVLLQFERKDPNDRDWAKGVPLTELKVNDDISNMYLVPDTTFPNASAGWTYKTGFPVSSFISSSSETLQYTTLDSLDAICFSYSQTQLCYHHSPTNPPLFNWTAASFVIPSSFVITNINWDNLPNGTLSFKQFCSYQKIYSVLPQ